MNLYNLQVQERKLIHSNVKHCVSVHEDVKTLYCNSVLTQEAREPDVRQLSPSHTQPGMLIRSLIQLINALISKYLRYD